MYHKRFSISNEETEVAVSLEVQLYVKRDTNPSPYEKLVNDDFYIWLFERKGLQGDPLHHRPKYVGRLMNSLFYDRMGFGVLRRLEELNPITDGGYRRYYHHQFLTPLGRLWMEYHLALATKLLQETSTWEEFFVMYNLGCLPKYEGMQLTLFSIN